MMVKHVADSVGAEQFVVRHAGAAGQSRFVQRIRRRYEQELACCRLALPGANMLRTLETLRARGLDPALRCACCATWCSSAWRCSMPNARPRWRS